MSVRDGAVLTVLIVLLVIAQSCLSGMFTKMPPRMELNAIDYDMTSERSIMVGDLQQLRGSIFSFEKTQRVDTVLRPVSATVTNEHYVLFNEIKMIRGSFFGKIASEIGQNHIVISDVLSFDLFKTLDSLQRTLALNGYPYTVCGVYHRDPLLALFSGDGSEIVYIPSKSDFDRACAADTPIQSVVFASEGDADSFEGAALYADLSRVTRNACHYQIHDFSKANRVIDQFRGISFFAMGILVMALLGEVLLRSIAGQALLIRNAIKTDSLRHIARRNALRWVFLLFLCASMIFACLIIYRATALDLYIPNRIIPSEYILDFGHYKRLIVDRIQASNVFPAYKASGYERLYGFELWQNVFLTGTAVVLSVRFYRNMRKVLKKSMVS